MSFKNQKKERRENPMPIDKLERNSLTLSLVIVILGLICLPNIEKGGDTWYVLMMVFILNALLLAWVIGRTVIRILKEKRDGE